MNTAPIASRPEGASDICVIHALARRAFAQMPYAGGDEQDLTDALRMAGALGSALTGNPLYDQRFGFALDPAACPAGQPPKYFMTLCFGPLRPSGPLAFHRLFNGLP